MARDLIIAGAPSNLRLPEGASAYNIESDLYDICERVKEIDENLYIMLLDPPQERIDGSVANYVIMESCIDGVERVVFKVEYLDGRVLDKLREIMAVSLHDRVEKLDKMGRKLEQEQVDNAAEELYERMGGQMRHDLARCGFTTPLPNSAPLRNKTAMRYRRDGRK